MGYNTKLIELFKKYKEEGHYDMDREDLLSMVHKTRDVLLVSHDDYNQLLRSLIPVGLYCYEGDYLCPFWEKDEKGLTVCTFADIIDYSDYKDYELELWQEREWNSTLLSDQVKECGVNEED